MYSTLKMKSFHSDVDSIIHGNSTPVLFAYICGPSSGPGHFLLSMRRLKELVELYQQKNYPIPKAHFLIDSRIGFGPNPETPREIMEEKLPELLRLMLSFRDRSDLGWDLYGGEMLFSAMENALRIPAPRETSDVDKASGAWQDACQNYHDELCAALSPYMWISNAMPTRGREMAEWQGKNALVVSGAVGGYWDRMIYNQFGPNPHANLLYLANTRTMLFNHFTPLFQQNVEKVCFLNVAGPIGSRSQCLLLNSSSGVMYFPLSRYLPNNVLPLARFSQASDVIVSSTPQCSQRTLGAILFAAMAIRQCEVKPNLHVFCGGESPGQDQHTPTYHHLNSMIMALRQWPEYQDLVEILTSIQWYEPGVSTLPPLYQLINQCPKPVVIAEGAGTISDAMKRADTMAIQIPQNNNQYINNIPGLFDVLFEYNLIGINEIREYETGLSTTLLNDGHSITLEELSTLARFTKNWIEWYQNKYAQLVDTMRSAVVNPEQSELSRFLNYLSAQPLCSPSSVIGAIPKMGFFQAATPDARTAEYRMRAERMIKLMRNFEAGYVNSAEAKSARQTAIPKGSWFIIYQKQMEKIEFGRSNFTNRLGLAFSGYVGINYQITLHEDNSISIQNKNEQFATVTDEDESLSVLRRFDSYLSRQKVQLLIKYREHKSLDDFDICVLNAPFSERSILDTSNNAAVAAAAADRNGGPLCGSN